MPLMNTLATWDDFASKLQGKLTLSSFVDSCCAALSFAMVFVELSIRYSRRGLQWIAGLSLGCLVDAVGMAGLPLVSACDASLARHCHLELLRKQLHDVVQDTPDPQGTASIQWRPLQVDDYEAKAGLAAAGSALRRNAVSIHSAERGAHGYAE